MSGAPYDAIAEWYDTYVQVRPLYREVVLPAIVNLAGDLGERAVVAGYFDERFWRSESSEGVRGRVGEYHRTLSTCLNTLVECRLILERLAKPEATGREADDVPGSREIPSILLFRARK